jgi:hypothetical protein
MQCILLLLSYFFIYCMRTVFVSALARPGQVFLILSKKIMFSFFPSWRGRRSLESYVELMYVVRGNSLEY